MAKAKKITKKQLESIKEVQQKTNAILLDIGFLEVQKTGLTIAHAQASEALAVIKAELEKKYGQINIDLKDGSYTEIDQSKENEVQEMEIVK